MSQQCRRTIAEAALAAVCLALLLTVVVDHREELAPWAFAAAVVCAVAQAGALPLRHARRRAAAAVALVAAAGLQLACPPELLPFAAYVAVGSLAAHLPPSRSWWGLAGLLALAALTQLPAPDGVTGTATAEQGLFLAVVAIGVHGYGDLRRNRAVRRQEEARRLVAQEQARIARELHDVVAHSVAVIVVQASAAGDVFDERPERARESLAAIEATARDTLGELRRLVGAIRTEEDAAGGDAAPRTRAVDGDAAGEAHGLAGSPAAPLAPQPGLTDLDALVARVRATGLDVTVTRTGPAGALPAAVDLSAYRIVQEALTNTLRHARATQAQIVVRRDGEAIELDVRDDGDACAGDDRVRGGHGTTGMRERAALLGGTLDAGPCRDGGYRVRARLPLGGTAARLPGAAA